MSEYVCCDFDLAEGIDCRELEQIVRCRDCEHMHRVRHWSGIDVDECWLHADPATGAIGKEPTEPYGFCAWGERKAGA